MKTIRDEEDLDDETAEGASSFAHAIATLCGGDLNNQASSEFHDFNLYLRSEAKARSKTVKGVFKLELTVEVTDDDVVGLTYSIKTKTPEPKRRAAVMWLSPGGNLSPQNPRQQDLPGLREVPGGRSNEAPREVARERAALKEI